ncbi:accessory Sec system protein Asp3 [Fructobacillus ficulneus]|uniref:Accessory Sec system protein Asp3 n=1 Tax=Fructobacillus ficulneus TaxID=157463 RepID=A0A0K8MIV7_9LACO|nr:accessory Sec system protein Asp3 [Fructobacillus ficulneus]GAP00114.1 hypothetical protein FFIC_281200 [Fructobacillus ficulneus]
MQYQIYWRPETKLSELQGAIVDYLQEDDVHYTNHFLPSGRIIASWNDTANYFTNKDSATLPRLKPGKVYRTIRRVKNSERMHAYLNWIFFDSQNEIILNQYQSSDKFDLQVPAAYDHYQLNLMSAGTGDFHFYEVDIVERTTGWLRDGDQMVTEHLGAYLTIPEKINTKTLRVIFNEPELKRTDYPVQSIKDAPQAVLYLATDFLHSSDFYDQRIMTVINEAKKQAKAKTVEFVGYGLISSAVAINYRRQIKDSHAVICDPSQLLDGSPKQAAASTMTDFMKSAERTVMEDVSADDTFLVAAGLEPNPSLVTTFQPQIDLLANLAYPAWPISKKEAKMLKKAESQSTSPTKPVEAVTKVVSEDEDTSTDSQAEIEFSTDLAPELTEQTVDQESESASSSTTKVLDPATQAEVEESETISAQSVDSQAKSLATVDSQEPESAVQTEPGSESASAMAGTTNSEETANAMKIAELPISRLNKKQVTEQKSDQPERAGTDDSELMVDDTDKEPVNHLQSFFIRQKK